MSDVLLCVTELVTNSVTHSAEHDAEPVAVEVRVSPTTLRVEITDHARGFESPRARRAALSEDEEERGWGLYIVELLADRWGVEPGELTRVWFEKDLG